MLQLSPLILPLIEVPAPAPIGEKAASAKMILKKVNEVCDRLLLSFYTEDETPLRSIEFKMGPRRLDPTLPLKGRIGTVFLEKIQGVVDVYPLNGTAKNRKFNITDYVRKQHRLEMQGILKIADDKFLEQAYPYCLVADFKDSSIRYENREQIASIERQFSNFFRQNRPVQGGTTAEIYDLVKRSKIALFINEGTLKADLIRHVFSKIESEYLHGTDTGSPVLCQLCEIIMNGFKKGWEVEVEGRTFKPDNYITVIDDEWLETVDSNASSRRRPFRLITFYPAHYQELYSEQSTYYQLVSQAYKVNHHVTDNTTILTLE